MLFFMCVMYARQVIKRIFQALSGSWYDARPCDWTCGTAVSFKSGFIRLEILTLENLYTFCENLQTHLCSSAADIVPPHVRSPQ